MSLSVQSREEWYALCSSPCVMFAYGPGNNKTTKCFNVKCFLSVGFRGLMGKMLPIKVNGFTYKSKNLTK